MALEKPPKTLLVAKGRPWAREVDASLVRDLEGSVDEKGLRTIVCGKDDSQAWNNHTQMKYKKLGYAIKDDGYQFTMTIPEADYQKNILKPIQDEGIRRVSRSSILTPDDSKLLSISTLEETPMKPEDFLDDSSEE